MIIQQEGIYPDTSNEDYHASHGLSNSNMSFLLPPHCPKTFWYQRLSGAVAHKETDAFNLGSAVHTYCFEPLEFNKRFYSVYEIPKKTTKLGKSSYIAMLEKANSRQILDKEDIEIVKAMGTNIINHAMWRNLMAKALAENVKPSIECSLAWKDEESGILLRSRPDFFTNTIILDLKTTKDSSPHAFSKAVADYAYHRQAALACDGLTKLTGNKYENVVLFVVDKTPPHFVRCYVLNESVIDQGRYEYKTAAKIYADCLEKNNWPSHPEIIENLDIPKWAYRSFENE